jgi:predicted 3-demethylubiquinone-9 3-methyltransferase (glyoxalase superfamily)
MIKQKISTYLWFDKQAKEAAEFYCSLFNNSRIVSSNPMIVVFELEGQKYYALNGEPKFKFNESISLFVECEGQEEVDKFWNALTANGGEESMCGWLKDRFGLSWQIVPRQLMTLMGDKDPARAQRAMQAMLKMKKIFVRQLEEAADRK